MNKFTPGPWSLLLRQSSPFGFRIISLVNDECVMDQDSAAYGTKQKTRADNEAGVGFPFSHEKFCTRAEAVEAVAKQDANAHLIATSPDLYTFAQEIAIGAYTLDEAADRARELLAKATGSA